MNTVNRVKPFNTEGFDSQRLAELIEIMGSEDEVRILVDCFKADFSAVCVEIAAWQQVGDCAQVKKRLHALKGAAANLGLLEISAAAACFELKLAQGEDCASAQQALQECWRIFTVAQ